MSILIRGMEMPTSCADCPFGDTLCCPFIPGVPALWAEYANAVKEKRLHSDCPLVPVPEHGDLIDRDALKAAICSRLCIESEEYLSPAEATIVNEIFAAPTIIPAEEGE